MTAPADAPRRPNDNRPAARAAKGLAAVIAVILVTGVTANYAIYHLAPHPDHPVADVLKRFDLGHEPSIPAFYSASALLAAALGAAFIGRFDRSDGGTLCRHWYLLAGLLVLLAVDENVMFHEMGTGMMTRLNLSGPLEFSWVIPGLLFAAAAGLSLLRFLRSLDARTRRLFLTAGFVFLSGAVGMETVAGAIFARAADHQEALSTLSHLFVQLIEEGLEMAGVAVLVYGLIDYADRAGLRIAVTQSGEPGPDGGQAGRPGGPGAISGRAAS
ncbi:hypothetical protein [Alienimonas sp. DA493]|uniref:hypothetical protein n=1 Tax=Alienimonas sp. DA493 TaxID=3373605 RepID=UPI0037552F2D